MKILFNWIIDYAYLILGELQMAFYKNPPKSYSESLESKTPIIILPGILGRWSFMKSLADALSLDGHRIYVIPELKNNLYDIPKSAKIVKDFIEKSKLSSAIFVCHSKGGLIGKYFLTYENNKTKVRKVIAIATPFLGSPSAKLVPSKAYGELDSESEIIKSLLLEKQENKKIVSIYPEVDNHIWTKNGSFLEGARNIQIGVFGHHKILFAKQTIEAVLKEAD